MTAASRSRPCPICKKPRAEEFAPFCSLRCRDRDLVRWFGDGYAVPGIAVNAEKLAANDKDKEN